MPPKRHRLVSAQVPPHGGRGCFGALPSLGSSLMVLVKVRILLGARVIGTPAKPFGEDATIQIVLEYALRPHANHSVRC